MREVEHISILALIGDEFLGTRLALLAVVVINLAFGFYVYRKNPRNLPNRVYAILAAAGSLWTLGLIVSRTASSPPVLDRLAFVGGSAVIVCVGALFYSVRRPPPLFRRHDMVVFAILAGIVALFSFTPLVYIESTVVAGVHYRHYGPLYPLFGLYMLSALVWIFVAGWRSLRGATGLTRLQLQYLTAGIALPAAAAITTNVVMPLFFKSGTLTIVGPFLTIPMVAAVAHVIIRHRFMDVHVVIRRGTVRGTAAAGTIVAAAALGAGLYWFPLEAERGPAQAFLIAASAATFALLVWGLLERGLHSYLYREQYDYRRIARDASQRMLRQLSVRELLHELCVTLRNTLQPETLSLWSLSDDNRFHRVINWSQREGSVAGAAAIPVDRTPLVQWLDDHRHSLLYDEPPPDPTGIAATKALRSLADLGADAAIPVHTREALVGFVLLGPKRSGNPYFTEDVTLLEILAGQTAIALTNARLHQMVVRARDQIKAIVETMPSGVITVDATATVTGFNRTAETMTGYQAAQVVGHQLPQGYPLALLLQATLTDGKSRQDELNVAAPSGRKLPVIVSTAPLMDRQGQLDGAVLVCSDLSYIKEAETVKRRVERLASLGAMASRIAHEIRNPLVAVKAHLQLLPERCSCAAQEDQQMFADVALKDINRIEALLDRLGEVRHLSRANFQLMDFRRLLSDTLLLVNARLAQANITSTEALSDECWIRGDPDQLKQLTLNLLMNAIDAMPDGGELRVACHANTSRAVIEISDTGQGIAPAIQETLFEPFVTAKPQGAGLGLAICRAIVDVHGGAIRAENRPGRGGATVRVEFQRASPED